jgi:hypothetical protein
MVKIAQPLTNAQLEILKTFRLNLQEAEMEKLRKLLVNFYADLLTQRADEVWEEQQWDEAKVEEMLNTKMRRRTS